MRNVLLFALIVFVQVSLDPAFCACETKHGKMLLVFHHMINIGLWFGSMFFGHHALHLMFLIFAMGLHIAMKGCFLTKLNHQMCNIQTNRHVLITFTNHIMNFLGSNADRLVYYLLAFFVAMYDVFQIRKMTFC